MEKMVEIVVNGERLEKERVDQEVRRLRMTEPGLSEKKADQRVADLLVRQTLLRQEAERRYPEVPQGEIEEEFTKLIAEHGGRKAFYQRFGLSAKDEPMIKRDLSQQVRVGKLLDELTASVHNPSREEIEGCYEEHKDRYIYEEMIKASHIVRSPDSADPETFYAEMVEIRKKLLSGADFATLADEYSGCNDRGGDLGYFGRGKMVDEFECVVFSMEPGEISPVFKTQFGYHVAKVFERKAERQMSLAEAKEQIHRELVEERKERAVSAWVKKQRAAGQVVVRS